MIFIKCERTKAATCNLQIFLNFATQNNLILNENGIYKLWSLLGNNNYPHRRFDGTAVRVQHSLSDIQDCDCLPPDLLGIEDADG